MALCFALFYGLVEIFLYATYAYLCDEPWLLANRDFVGHRRWPAWLTLWRDAANATLVVLGGVALGRAILVEWRSLPARAER